MPRLRLELPDELPFTTEIDVRVTDVNYGRHLGNDAMLGMIHEARFQFLRGHGLSEHDIDGTALVVADAAIVYLAEAFAGDRLRFEVGVGQLARVGCDMFYRVTRLEDDTQIAEAKTGIVFVDPTTRRPVAVPAAIRELAS